MSKLLKFGPFFVIIAALLWSFDGILRRGLYSLPPTTIVFYEHLLGLVLLLFLASKWLKDLKKLSKKEWGAVFIVALFSGALGTIFYTAALGKINYIQFSVVVLLQQLQPVWAILTAAILLKEKITKRFMLYVVLALISAFLISFKNLEVNLSSGDGTTIAALLALGAGICWGTSTAFSKYVLNKVSFLTATALRFIFTPIFALIFILSLGQTDSLLMLTTDQWKTLFIITFTTGLLALGIYYYGLKKIPASRSTIYELVFPASAIFIDYIYFKNTLSITQVIGVVLLVFILYKITQNPKLNKK